MEYRLFLSDLPKRAWDNYTGHHFKHDVSALLTVCWAVFVVPVERLDLLIEPKKLNAKGSPSKDAASGHKDVIQLVEDWESLKSKTVKEVLGQTFGSEEGLFTPKNDPRTGRGGPRPGSQKWLEAVRGYHERSDDPKFGEVVKCLRHGLSHANIWTDPPSDGGQEKQIERIVIANFPTRQKGQGPPTVLILHHLTLHLLAERFVKWLKGQSSLTQIGAMSVSRERERAA